MGDDFTVFAGDPPYWDVVRRPMNDTAGGVNFSGSYLLTRFGFHLREQHADAALRGASRVARPAKLTEASGANLNQVASGLLKRFRRDSVPVGASPLSSRVRIVRGRTLSSCRSAEVASVNNHVHDCNEQAWNSERREANEASVTISEPKRCHGKGP